MNIVEFYTGVLTAIGLHVDPATGVVSINRPGLVDPIKIDGKILVLPSQQNLMSGNAFLQTHIFFHPISQSLIRKESKVMKKLRAIINVRFYEILVALMESNIRACANNFSDTTASPHQLKLMSTLSGAGVVTDKVVAALSNVLNATSPNEGHRLINIYIRKGLLNDKNYSAVANVSFPIYQESTEDKPKIFGVNVNSKANMKIIRELFGWLVPQASVEHHYSRGSCDLTAPNFHALMLSVGAIAEVLNIAVHESRNILQDPDSLMMDLSWMAGLENLARWSTEVPSQPGNEGEPLDDTGSNPAPVTLQADAIAHPTIAQQYAIPKLGAPLPGMAPAATATPATPATPEAPKKQLLGSPLTAAFMQPKEKTSSFQSPVSGQAVNHSRAQIENVTHSQELELKLREEALALAAKNLQSQIPGMTMPQMSAVMPNMTTAMMQQYPNPAVGMGIVPPMTANMGNPLYQQLMMMLQQQYPPVATAILSNPQLNQMLYQFPPLCQAVMQQPMLINQPQMLFQMMQNLQGANGGGYGINAGQALASGTTVGRMLGEQQRAQKQKEQMILEHQKHLAALQQNAYVGNTNMNFTNMGGLTPQQLAMMQYQMTQTGMNPNYQYSNGGNLGFAPATTAPAAPISTPFNTTL